MQLCGASHKFDLKDPKHKKPRIGFLRPSERNKTRSELYVATLKKMPTIQTAKSKHHIRKYILRREALGTCLTFQTISHRYHLSDSQAYRRLPVHLFSGSST